jgi:hypothetical protein
VCVYIYIYIYIYMYVCMYIHMQVLASVKASSQSRSVKEWAVFGVTPDLVYGRAATDKVRYPCACVRACAGMCMIVCMYVQEYMHNIYIYNMHNI